MGCHLLQPPSIEDIAKPYNPNPVVSELEVRPGKPIPGHVAGDTPRDGHRTARRSALSRRRRPLAAAVAGQAFGVVRSGFTLQVLVGVMAGKATTAAITRIEATAFGQAVWLEADGWDSLDGKPFQERTSRLAAAAKPHSTSGRQSAGIKTMGLLQFPAVRRVHLCWPGTVDPCPGDPGYHL